MNVEKIIFQQSGWVPNNQGLPVLIYRSALMNAGSPGFEATFSKNGWTGVWRNGVFDFQHYHSGAQEVLGMGGGSATLLIGGPDGATALYYLQELATKTWDRRPILRWSALTQKVSTLIFRLTLQQRQ